MGYYLNPPDMTKEEFIDINGGLINISKDALQDEHKSMGLLNGLRSVDKALVAHVLNGEFTAAILVPTVKEAWRVSHPEDLRPMTYYWVWRDALTPSVLGGVKLEEISP